MTPSLVMYAWPVTLALLSYTVITVWVWARQSPRAKINWLGSIGIFLIVFAILIYGTLHRAGENWQPQAYSYLVNYIVLAFLGLQFSLSGFLIYRASIGARLVTSSVLVWAMYFSLSASFITLMSVTGQWL
jgi:hypothetical protein